MVASPNVTDFKDGSYAYPTEHITNFDTKDILLVFSFCFIFTVGVAGNSLVIYLLKFKNSRALTTTETLIYYLAVADLMSSIFNPIMFIYWTLTFHKAWHFAEIGCKILPSATRVTVSFSIGIILIITLDRCRLICQPFEKQLKSFQLHVAVILALILSIVFELPYPIYQEIDPKSTCQVPDSAIPGFAYPIVTIYILRDTFFIGIFSVTVFFIRRGLYDSEKIHTLQQQSELYKLKRVVIMLITMATIFTLLVFPRDILHVTFIISWLSPPGLPYTKAFLDTNSFLKFLHMCNCICNPFIYARLHGKFRRRLVRMVRRLLQREDYDTIAEERTFISFDFVQSMYPKSRDTKMSPSGPIQFRLTRMSANLAKKKCCHRKGGKIMRTVSYYANCNEKVTSI
ncbi:C5a anaphylatoxin chemotactic receptor 1-like [Hydractinia symbiolongicarpus]|uniref:C5a anaphylatoxin chemotactic receptor 1-like n=1 Tax=Hydractinia symbiolongicarpus TaxID=13093 RepID=UPI00254DD3B9|nr:C5a anaphylatoxin chemotactic receptor 1-like [Hydractinia symbiolongicarpus]